MRGFDFSLNVTKNPWESLSKAWDDLTCDFEDPSGGPTGSGLQGARVGAGTSEEVAVVSGAETCDQVGGAEEESMGLAGGVEEGGHGDARGLGGGGKRGGDGG